MYRSIRITGADRIEFLQGQLTQDVSRLDGATSLTFAWCTPKGRVLVTGRLLARADSIHLVVPAEAAAMTEKRLGLYRLRAKVELAPADGFRAVACDARSASELVDWRTQAGPDDARGSAVTVGGLTAVLLEGDTAELYATDAAAGDNIANIATLDEETWRRTRIKAGQVDIGAGNSERFTPHMLSLDLAGAVSFTKGCYTGQEIVARTQHRGRVKRRLAGYRTAGTAAATGDKLVADGREVGEVVNAAGDLCLAVTSEAAGDGPVTIGGAEAMPFALPY